MRKNVSENNKNVNNKKEKFIIHAKNPEKSYQQGKEKRIFFGITISGQKNMVAAFPAAKLGLLVIKQITKPLANSIAKRAAKSPFFRNYLCIPTANFFHHFDVKVRMRILNLGKVSKVKKLDEKKAIDTGAQVSKLNNSDYDSKE